jgi:hypothetical protein
MGVEYIAEQEFDPLALHPVTCCHTERAFWPINFLLMPLGEAALKQLHLKAVAFRNDNTGCVFDNYPTQKSMRKANYINIAACFMYD